MRRTVKSIVMKLAHVFTLVIVLHVAVIGVLFVTPGCASDRSPGVIPADPIGQPRPTSEQPTQVAASPDRPSPASGITRYPPTRPSWNVNESSSPDVIVPPQPTRTPQPSRPPQPARAPEPIPTSGETTYVAEELEVISPSDATMSRFNTAPAPSRSGRRAPGPQPSTPVPGKTYIVKKGDTLGAIARRHGVPLDDLMSANGYTRNTANRLRVGEMLTIPPTDDQPEAPAAVPAARYSSATIDQEGLIYRVEPGDSLSRIAARHGSTVAAIKSANGLSSDRIIVGQELLVPKVESEPEPAVGVPDNAGRVTYIVERGDTLGAIARRYDVTVKAIMEANGIMDPRRLRVDQKLIIPTELSPVAPQPTRPPATRPQPAPAAVPAPLQPALPAEPSPPQPERSEAVDWESMDLDSIEPVDVEEAPR